MAVAGHEWSAGSSAATTFTMDVGPGAWKPGPAPAAGDLVVLHVARPELPVAGPPDWNAVEGRTFWKQWGPRELATVTFSAPEAFGWEIKGYAIQAGTYELPEANPASSYTATSLTGLRRDRD